MSSLVDPTAATPTNVPVKVRFCPSPTGTPHVGLIRTMLYNWVFAKHHGGSIVFRIEDTDAARNTQEGTDQLIEACHWLGLTWDEGIVHGGPQEPYYQSQRGDIYRDALDALLKAGHLYEAFSTPEEVEARHRAAGRDPKLGYDGFDRDLTAAQRQAFRDEGRPAVLRLRMPPGDCTFTDLIRGEMNFPEGTTPDFAVARADGSPLYTFVNPLDDALMGVTHVLRGEDLLSSTPRQIALYKALMDVGIAQHIPTFGHLPLVMGEGNRKLSKRDPQSDLFLHRDRGFIPEGLLNYLALLGWSIAPDRDVFSMDEMIAAFDIGSVQGNAARFDQKKAEAINAEQIRRLDVADLAQRLIAPLANAGLVGATPSERENALINAVAPLVQTRIKVLSEAVDMLEFLFVAPENFTVQPEALATLKTGSHHALHVTEQVLTHQAETGQWSTSDLEEALKTRLIDELGLKPRVAYSPLRVAVSGKRISPPLFECLELLGPETTLVRVRSLLATLPADEASA